MNVYLISGLGADKRIFSNLSFSDQYVINHIEWISPTKREGLVSYSKRLSEQIDQSEPFILIGVSFGGMIAVEICSFLKPIKTIIISSVTTDRQIPWYYKLSGMVNLHRLVPIKILKAPTILTFWFFGTKTKEQKSLLTQILNDTDDKFLKWAISKITTWKQKIRPENLYHIHGTSDRILPLAFINPDLQIQNGGHLMVYDQYDQISCILADKMGSH